MDQISKGVRFKFDIGRQKGGDEYLLQAIKRRFKGQQDLINQFTTEGNELAETVSTFLSIDEALHWWRERPTIVQLGKAAIAKYVLAAEKNSSLALKTGKSQIDIDEARGTWLHTFMSIALSGLDRGSVSSAFSNVTFINFNYDRTIEQYLYLALQQRAGVKGAAAASVVSSLNMIRPYGSLGKLDWDETPEVPFGLDWEPDVFSISQNIRTFTEQVEQSPVLELIDDALENAKLIVFLGFGFHQQNLALFVPGNGKTRGSPKTVVASVFGIDQRNYAAIEARLRVSLGIGHEGPLLVPLKASQLLSDLRLSVSMAAA